MNDQHILEILDGLRFTELSENELGTIQIHSAACSDCRRAFETARISSVLLNVRAEMPPAAAPPFFETKILQLIRENQNLPNPLAAFRRWWQASYPLVCSMLVIVFVFIALTFLAPKSETDGAVSTYNLYSTDSVILNQRAPRNLTEEQALEVIYNAKSDSQRK